MDHNRTGTTERIGAYVRTSLQERGITQLAASEQTGIPLTTLKRHLAGTSPMDTAELEKVAHVLGLRVVDLFVAAEDES